MCIETLRTNYSLKQSHQNSNCFLFLFLVCFFSWTAQFYLTFVYYSTLNVLSDAANFHITQIHGVQNKVDVVLGCFWIQIVFYWWEMCSRGWDGKQRQQSKPFRLMDSAQLNWLLFSNRATLMLWMRMLVYVAPVSSHGVWLENSMPNKGKYWKMVAAWHTHPWMYQDGVRRLLSARWMWTAANINQANSVFSAGKR